MPQMQPARVEAVRLDSAVGMRGKVAFFQVAESDSFPRCVNQAWTPIRRLAVVLDESHDVRAFGQHKQPLLQSHEQVIDLPRLVLGLVPFDLAKGEGAQFSVEAEENSVASVSF